MAEVARPRVTVMIFTLNEEIHLPSCLASLGWCDDVIVIDSNSTDRTEQIARDGGARYFTHTFEGFGKQRMWGLQNTAPIHEWVLILDADERVTPDLVQELSKAVHAPAAVAAFRIKRRFHMWGRWLRYSGLYPTWVVRLVRNGRVRYVNRGHAETQEVDGQTKELSHDLIDESVKGIDEWFERQNRYSSHEAEYEIAQGATPFPARDLLSGDPMRRRAAAKRLGASLPFRPTIYFLYSYILRGGILEGRDGLIFCMMRAQYHRMIVAKKHDMRRRK